MSETTLSRALVTGATGFVGSHVARVLRARGVEVHAVVRSAASLEKVPDLDVVAHVDDGTTAGMASIVAAARPDATFHLATNFISEHRPDDVAALVADNIGFPARLADALADQAGATGVPAPFVNTGTGWQHVGGARYRPKNLYAATKQAFEDVLRFYSDGGRLRVVTVNLYDSYGPLDRRPKLLAALVRALRTGTPVEMNSGRALVDLVHGRDVVDALVLATDAREGVYALSSGRPLTLRELVDVLGAVAGRPVPVHWDARPDREGDMLEPWEAGPPVPGWTPAVTLEDGLRELLDEV